MFEFDSGGSPPPLLGWKVLPPAGNFFHGEIDRRVFRWCFVTV